MMKKAACACRLVKPKATEHASKSGAFNLIGKKVVEGYKLPGE